jgi:plastocyanin
MRNWKLSVIAAAAASVLLLGACASKNANGAAAGNTTPQAAAQASQTPSPTASSGAYGASTGRYGSGGGATPAAKKTGTASSTVSLSNFSFGPSKVSIKHGATIALKNVAAATPHSFVIAGQNIDVVIAPGSTSDLKINLPPGTYQFFCKFHKALGMTGTLTVG